MNEFVHTNGDARELIHFFPGYSVAIASHRIALQIKFKYWCDAKDEITSIPGPFSHFTHFFIDCIFSVSAHLSLSPLILTFYSVIRHSVSPLKVTNAQSMKKKHNFFRTISIRKSVVKTLLRRVNVTFFLSIQYSILLLMLLLSFTWDLHIKVATFNLLNRNELTN